MKDEHRQDLMLLLDMIETVIGDDDFYQIDYDWQDWSDDLENVWGPIRDGETTTTEGVLPDGTVLRNKDDVRAAILKIRDELGDKMLSMINPIIKLCGLITNEYKTPRGFTGGNLYSTIAMLSKWKTPEDIRRWNNAYTEFRYVAEILRSLSRSVSWALEETKKKPKSIRYYLGI